MDRRRFGLGYSDKEDESKEKEKKKGEINKMAGGIGEASKKRKKQENLCVEPTRCNAVWKEVKM